MPSKQLWTPRIDIRRSSMTAMTEAQPMGEELWATLQASRNVIVEE